MLIKRNELILNQHKGNRKSMMTVEEKVQEYLKLNGISQKYFAELIGISHREFNSNFNGKKKNEGT